MEVNMKKFQRENPYNSLLPYSEEIKEDADRILNKIKANFKDCLKPKLDLLQISKCLDDFEEFLNLYGFRFSAEDHVWFVKILYGFFVSDHVDPIHLDRYGKILVKLTKKDYLLFGTNLVLDWKPLYQLFYKYQDSKNVSYGLETVPKGLKTTLRSVIGLLRHFFSHKSTQEMLDEWRPLLCPFNNVGIITGMEYLSLFLPVHNNYPPDVSWKLWFEEFMALWKSWSNAPSWETELFELYQDLAWYNIGNIDWSPHIEFIFPKFMAVLGIPGTGYSFLDAPNMSSWIIATIGGSETGRTIQKYLSKMISAMESYYHPVNADNSAAFQLHQFVENLCITFVKRLNFERYNTKWECPTPIDQRLSDSDIEEFILCLKPVMFHMMFNEKFDYTSKPVFNILSTIRPDLVIPTLLEKFKSSIVSLTESHSFKSCLVTLKHCSRPLVENYPMEVIQILKDIIPGIDINDIWKTNDILSLIKSIFEMIWLIDFNGGSETKMSKTSEISNQNSAFDDIIMKFTDRCFVLLENISRENVREEIDTTDISWNSEESTAFTEITSTFQKLVTRLSKKNFTYLLEKLKNYAQSNILEPALAGPMFASLVKGLAIVQPEQTLDFFIPYLCSQIEEILLDKSLFSKERKVADQNLKFKITMLKKLLSGDNINSKPSQVLFKHIEKLMATLDKTLALHIKDEYMEAVGICWNIMINLAETKPVLKNYSGLENIVWSGQDEFQWAKSYCLEDLISSVEWYVPGKQEIEIVQKIFEKYLQSQISLLDQWMKGNVKLEREEVRKCLAQLVNLLWASSTLIPSMKYASLSENIFENNLKKSQQLLQLSFINGQPIRETILDFIQRLQCHLLKNHPDDTISLKNVISIYKGLIFRFGWDQDHLKAWESYHQYIKKEYNNRLISNKKHFLAIHLQKLRIQHMKQILGRNSLLNKEFSEQIIKDVYELSVSQYSDVRSLAQSTLCKIVSSMDEIQTRNTLIPLLEKSLKPGVSHQEFKGALYIISKHCFLGSWKNTLLLGPALVQAQHSEKLSIVVLLKDISNRCNRDHPDFAWWSLPIKSAIMSENTAKLLGLHEEWTEKAQNMLQNNSTDEDFLKLESELCKLVQSKDLHWRHHQMALGILLTMICSGHKPSVEILDLWLECLIHDDKTIRGMAFQALIGILKIYKVKRPKTTIDHPDDFVQDLIKPGIRSDNEWLQYKKNMTEEETIEYWNKPFNVKSGTGFYTWTKPQIVLRISDDSHLDEPSFLWDSFRKFFKNDSKKEKFIELNSNEQIKGKDSFSDQKANFYKFLFESFGLDMVKYFEPYVIKFCSSVEECEQICASEIIAGLVKGSRFWSYEPTNRIWSKIIIPAFKEVFAKVTTETLHDWEDCLKYGIKKTDPNRIHWLFNLFLDYLENNFSASIDSSGAGAFNQSSFLILFRKVSKELKWKLRELYAQIFSNLKQITSHPYHMVRKEISGFLVTLLSLDIKYDGETGGQEDMFPGFPKVRQYLDEILPILNDEKMPLTPIDVKNANTILDDHEASRKIFKDTYHKVLETVAIWIEEYINCTFITFPKDIYEILPILCQFVEDEEIYKQCLKTLSFWSISIVPHNDLSHVLEIIWKIMATSADSRKAKLNCLNFLQKFLSSNFMSLCFDEKLVCQIETQILSFMSDPTIQVREKASKICSGLVHWGFFNQDVVKNKLLKKFQDKISHDFVLHKMIEAVQFKKQTSIKSKKHQSSNILEDCDELATYHSGILGLCAIVEAHPYNVPDYVPGLLMELVRHLHDPQPIPKTIKNTFQEFKRTHQDNWQEHKLKFSDHELIVLNDLLVSPNYYA